jgi:hypothetical protein
MKLLSAKVVDGRLDLPEGTLREGALVTVLVPEDETGFELTEAEQEELAAAVAEADRGESVDGWQLLDELRGA